MHEKSYTGSGPKVAVLGDSITYMSAEQIRDALPSYAVQIDATIGEQIDGQAGNPPNSFLSRDIANVIASKPAVVVVNLGTNQGNGDLVNKYGRLVAQLRPACVIGVTVQDTYDPAKWAEDPAPVRDLNAALPSLVDVVADWNAVADPYVNGDVHPNAEGSRVLAQLYADAIPKCLQKP